MTRSRILAWVLPAMIAVITMSAFVPSLSGEFLNWDDGVGLVKNEAYRGLGPAQLGWIFANTRVGHYIPLTWLTFAINYVVNGMDPRGYHLANLLLHGTNAALFFLVATSVFRAAAALGNDGLARPSIPIVVGAALSALIFGLHPQRVEPVAWITGRATLLCAFFYLLAVLGYLRATAPDRATPGKWWWRMSVASFGAAVLSHPLAMTLPLTLLLLDAFPLGRRQRPWPRLLGEKVPYAVVAVLAAAVAVLARHLGVLQTPDASRDIVSRLVFLGRSLWLYPATFIWPVRLSPLYELPARADLGDPRSLLPLAGGMTILVVLVLLRHRFPGGLAAWGHMAVSVVPVSGLIYSGVQLGADRYAYQADLGFALVAGYGLTWLLVLRQRGRIRDLVAGAAVCGAFLVAVALGVSSSVYSGIWQDSETLWRWAVEADGECALCNVNLSEAIITGAARQGDGAVTARAGEAEAYARRALALRSSLGGAYFNLGTALAAQQRYDEADAALHAYLELVPWDPAGPERIGLLRIAQERYAEAIPLLRRAVAMDPGSPNLRRHLAEALREQAGQLERAGRHSEATVVLGEMTRVETGGWGRRRVPSP